MQKFLFRLHGWLAIAASLPLVLICLSGSVLVFRHELDTLLMPQTVRVIPAPGGRLDLDTLLGRLRASLPQHEPTGWALFRDGGRADLVYVVRHRSSEWSQVLLDPYRGTILAGPVPTNAFFSDWLLEFHHELLLGHTGVMIGAAVSIALCVLGLSGLWLHRRFWTSLPRLRRHARRIVYYGDLHKLSGTLAAPVLLLTGFTGAWWNIAHLAAEAREPEPHRVHGALFSTVLSLNGLLDSARRAIPAFVPTYISLPWEPGRDIMVFGDVADSSVVASEYASHVSFDAWSGELRGAADIRSSSASAKVLDSYRRLHFGDFGGLSTRLLWFLGGLGPALLAFTGSWAWASRRNRSRRVA